MDIYVELKDQGTDTDLTANIITEYHERLLLWKVGGNKKKHSAMEGGRGEKNIVFIRITFR